MEKQEILNELNDMVSQIEDYEIQAKLKDVISRINLSMFSADQLTVKAKKPQVKAKKPQEELGPKLSDLIISPRLSNILHAAGGIFPSLKGKKFENYRVGDLAKVRKEEWIKLRNLGRKSLTEIEILLDTYGFQMK